MQATISLPLDQDIQVVLPDSLDLISTYVLQEQQDWFEDEIRFVRKLLKPGQKVLDIGANYGLFSLSMAKCVGASGRVWSVEPASSTAAILQQSISLNAFHQIQVLQMALSDKVGTAHLSLNDNAELNELVREGSSQGPSEKVPLSTLDTLLQSHDWHGIDFVKMDAEGEETAIVRGGRRFFELNSPLVQFEVKASTQVNTSLIQVFEDIGYRCYRLVPGLNILEPHDQSQALDSFQLNLFCCKPDRAAQLAKEGHLTLPDVPLPFDQAHQQARQAQQSSLDRLRALPYGQVLSPLWARSHGEEGSDQTALALALHHVAHDPDQHSALRLAALKASLQALKAIVGAQPHLLHEASLARVARELGERRLATKALGDLWDRIQQTRQINPSLPFLTPVPETEAISPENTVELWIVCSLLEGLERGLAFSSFFTGQESLERLAAIHQFGFGSPQMRRRFDLMLKRNGLTPPSA